MANHPNSLVDPALVAMAAGRPVRFLARAPLFQHPAFGWFIRGMGAIPVHRHSDAPELVVRNEDMFRAVWRALARDGSAVGIFPEGMSHSGPSLAPLKTGAARIALGAGEALGHTLPIIPVGLTFRAREQFRSEALALVGRTVEWEDLMTDSHDSAHAVRELTQRIRDRLHEVTLNLERWEDAPVVEAMEAIHSTELGGGESPGHRLRRSRDLGRALQTARAVGSEEANALARDIHRHHRVLHHLHLRPHDLQRAPRVSVALRWIARNLFFFGLLTPPALLGGWVFWPARRFVSLVEERLELESEVQASYHVMGGAAAIFGWSLLLVSSAYRVGGWAWTAGVLGALPVLGMAMLVTHGRWTGAVQDLRRFILLRERSDIRSRLLARQRDLARRIEKLRTGELSAPSSASGRPRHGE